MLSEACRCTLAPGQRGQWPLFSGQQQRVKHGEQRWRLGLYAALASWRKLLCFWQRFAAAKYFWPVTHLHAAPSRSVYMRQLVTRTTAAAQPQNARAQTPGAVNPPLLHWRAVTAKARAHDRWRATQTAAAQHRTNRPPLLGRRVQHAEALRERHPPRRAIREPCPPTATCSRRSRALGTPERVRVAVAFDGSAVVGMAHTPYHEKKRCSCRRSPSRRVCAGEASAPGCRGDAAARHRAQAARVCGSVDPDAADFAEAVPRAGRRRRRERDLFAGALVKPKVRLSAPVARRRPSSGCWNGLSSNRC